MKTFRIALILVVFWLVACNSRQPTPLSPIFIGATGSVRTIVATPTLMPSPTATAALSEEMIALSIVDGSPSSVHVPARQQLLIVAIDDEGYKNRCCKNVTWHIGYLNLKEKQFITIQSVLSGDYPESISWKPDGTQFIYTEISLGVPPRYSIVFRADGKEVFTARYGALWLQGGKYLSAITCEASNINWGIVHTIYDTDSWTKVCQICEGTSLGLAMECSNHSCSPSQECPPQEASTKKEQATVTSSQPNRYQAVLEDKEIRIIDSQTGKQNVYIIPGYHIVLGTWSPD